MLLVIILALALAVIDHLRRDAESWRTLMVEVAHAQAGADQAEAAAAQAQARAAQAEAANLARIQDSKAEKQATAPSPRRPGESPERTTDP
jgi:hypothetical protein